MKFFENIRAWFRDEEHGIAKFSDVSPLAVLPHVDARS